METIECPACAGPDNAFCDTCNGTSEVSKETFDAFNANKEAQEVLNTLRMSIEDAVRNSETKEELVESVISVLG